MASPPSAVHLETAMQTLPARPTIKRTYGKPKMDVSALQASQSFTSDLTSLSQLSQAPPSSAVGENRRSRTSPSDSDSGNEFADPDSPGNSHSDNDVVPKTVTDSLREIDNQFDTLSDGDEPPRQLCSPRRSLVQQRFDQEEPQPLEHKRERVVSGASSSSTNEVHRINNKVLASTSSPPPAHAHRSSPPTSPRSPALKVNTIAEDEETVRPAHSRKPLKAQNKILDSEDEESDSSRQAKRLSVSPRRLGRYSKAHRRKVIDGDEDENEHRLGTGSEDEDLPSLGDVGEIRKARRQKSQSEDEVDVETQKTEGIEQYEDSQFYQSNRLFESPDGKKKSRKPRPPSKKDEEEAHRIAEQSRRSRHASIMPRSKPARPLSEISQRLQVADHSNRPFNSMRPSLMHRPRSSSTKPALSLRAASIPHASMRSSAKPLSKAIEIGSSSAIYDFNLAEDSYDPTYLRTETQSQSQDRQQSEPTLPTKASTSPICDAEGESDEELPDVVKIMQERQEREKRAKALQAKKAALLARQQGTRERSNPAEDVKGKGREIVMDLDSDPEELEIEMTRATTPVIKADHRTPHSHKFMRDMNVRSVKQEHEHEMSESQFKRAGRTFHHGDQNVVVNPHVTMKAPRTRSTRKSQPSVTTHGVNNLLMEKAKQQALNDKIKRMDDWRRRGGTLRHDHGTDELPQNDGDEEITDDRAKELIDAIQARAIETDGDLEDDEEDDEDYIASDEDAILSGEEIGNTDEADSAASDAEQMNTTIPRHYNKQPALDDPDLAGETSSLATTQAILSEESDVSGAESEDAIVVSTRMKPAMRTVFEDEDSQRTGSRSTQCQVASTAEPRLAQATQYHDFVVKDGAPAFPEFDKIKDISLTQAFGKVGGSQELPQASRAAIDEGEGFSQMFEDENSTGFPQATLPAATGSMAKLAGPIPSMFRKGGDSSPEVQRHAFGEAPMLLDAALRDAQIREEAERAYEQIQFDRTRLVGDRQESDLTRTPGSTISDEMPPLPPVTMSADRYSDRGMVVHDLPSEERDDELIDMEDIHSPSIPKKLRRAGDEEKLSPKRSLNAFDVLQMGQQRHVYGRDASKKQKNKRSDFIAEEVEESEDEGDYSMLRKINDEGDEEDGSDLDGEVEELVDNVKGDPDEEEAQDEMVDEHHRDWVQKDEAKTHKLVEKVIAGKLKKRRRGDDGGLSDSDYDDDIMHREAKARKPKKFSSKMEALTANPETQSFAQTGMDDGTADINGDFLEAPDPTAEGASEDEEYGSDTGDVPVHRSSRRYQDRTHAYSHDYEKSIIDQAIYGMPSSPQQELVIEDSLAIITSRTLLQKKLGTDCFDDIDLSYAETQTSNRRVVHLEKEDSQNENGRGPGRTSAVTNFVRRRGGDSTGAGGGAARTVKIPVLSSTVVKQKEKKGSRPTSEVGNRGRLAAARQSKRSNVA